MLDSISGFLFKLFEDFSWKRFSAAVLALAIFSSAVLIYERYTSNFELSRIQRSAEILSTLHELAPSSQSDKEVDMIRIQLLSDLSRLVSQRQITTGIPQALLNGLWSDPIRNFLAGAAPWLLFFLLSLPKSFKQGATNPIPVATYGILALICGWLATFLNFKASVMSTFLTFLVAPFLLVGIIGVIAAIAIPQFAAYRMKAYNAAAVATLKQAVVMIETYFSDNGIFPSTIQEAGFVAIPQPITLNYQPLTEDAYFLSSTHEKGNKDCFYFSGSQETYWKDKGKNVVTEAGVGG